MSLNKRTYVDEDGYEREEVEHSTLIHRQVAYKEIYLPNKKDYPLPFSKYVVHHIDGNKLNNDVSNLQIITQEKHDWIHGFDEKRGPSNIAVGLFLFGLPIAAGILTSLTDYFSYKSGIAIGIVAFLFTMYMYFSDKK